MLEKCEVMVPELMRLVPSSLLLPSNRDQTGPHTKVVCMYCDEQILVHCFCYTFLLDLV